MERLFSAILVASFACCAVLSQSSTPAPSVSNSPTCLQSRASSDPTGALIFAAIARDDTVDKACNSPSATIDTVSSTSYYIVNGDYTFNSSFEAGPSGLPSTSCVIKFNTILTTCVEHGNFWGGWLAEGGSNFSIVNEKYPSVPLPSAAFTVKSGASLGRFPSPGLTHTPGATASPGLPSAVSTGPISVPSELIPPSSDVGPSHSSSPMLPDISATTQSSGAPLPLITSFVPEALTLSTIDPSITGDTVIRTWDPKHPTGLYPFIKGGPHCFFCPPGIQGGGLMLFGMGNPGVYPPPTPPPFPGVKDFPTISIGNNLVPIPENEPTSDTESSVTSTAPPSYESTIEPSSTPTLSLSTEPTIESVSTTGSPSPSSSCVLTAIASDCSVICSSASSMNSCSKTCYATTTGCSALGTTVTSTSSPSACGLILPFSKMITGGTIATESWDTDFSIPLTGFSTVPYSVTYTSLDGTSTGFLGPTGLSVTDLTASVSLSAPLYSSSNPPSTTDAPTASWDATSCMAVENPRYYLSAMVCSCNDGHTYPTMTATNILGPCGFTTSPGPALSTMPIVSPSPTPYDPALPRPSASGIPTSTTSMIPVINGSDGDSTCADSFPDAYTDIFTCNGNATLFQMFAPAGTPHGQGVAASDEEGWGTFEGGGCYCSGGSLCCARDAHLSMPNDDNYEDALVEINGGIVAAPVGYFEYLDGACSCNGDNDAIYKRRLEEISSGSHEQGPKAKRPKVEHPDSPRSEAIAEKGYSRSVIAQKTPNYDDRSALVLRDEHSKDWNTYRKKGQKLWGEFQNRDMNLPDNDPCNLDGEYATPQVKIGVTPVTKATTFLNMIGVPTEPHYISMKSYYPKVGWEKKLVGEFENSYSPRDGVLVASVNARHMKDDNPDTKTMAEGTFAPDQWSWLAWDQWKRACVTVSPGTSDFSNIKIIVRKNVDNSITRGFMWEAMQADGKSPGQITYFYPSDPDDPASDNAFWPLLASPNGNGIIHLLTDVKIALRSKSITRIGVYFHEEGGREYNYLWAELTGANINQDKYPLPP